MTATTMTSSYADRHQLFSGLDIAGLVAAAIMALGPLTAYAVGF